MGALVKPQCQDQSIAPLEWQGGAQTRDKCIYMCLCMRARCLLWPSPHHPASSTQTSCQVCCAINDLHPVSFLFSVLTDSLSPMCAHTRTNTQLTEQVGKYVKQIRLWCSSWIPSLTVVRQWVVMRWGRQRAETRGKGGQGKRTTERIIVRLYVPVLWKDSPARPKRFMHTLYNHMLNLLMRSPQGLQLRAYE